MCVWIGARRAPTVDAVSDTEPRDEPEPPVENRPRPKRGAYPTPKEEREAAQPYDPSSTEGEPQCPHQP